MIYSAEAMICDNPAVDDRSQVKWVPLDEALRGGYWIAELKIIDVQRNKIVGLASEPDAGEIAFARNVIHFSAVYEAATAWRQAIIDTNGVAVAENALMAALEGRTLKEGYRHG